MSKGIGPLLLLGGAAALAIAASKKKGQTSSGPTSAHGIELIGNCQGTRAVDGAKYQEWFLKTHWEPFLQSGSLDGQGLMVKVYKDLFPQCHWPPSNPDGFMIHDISWSARVEVLNQLLKQLHSQGDDLLASYEDPTQVVVG